MNKFFLLVIAASCAVIAYSMKDSEQETLLLGMGDMDENNIGDY